MSATKLLGRALIKGDDVQRGSSWQDVMQQRRTAHRLHHQTALNEIRQNAVTNPNEINSGGTLEQMEESIKRLKAKENAAQTSEEHTKLETKQKQINDEPLLPDNLDDQDSSYPDSYRPRMGYDEE